MVFFILVLCFPGNRTSYYSQGWGLRGRYASKSRQTQSFSDVPRNERDSGFYGGAPESNVWPACLQPRKYHARLLELASVTSTADGNTWL